MLAMVNTIPGLGAAPVMLVTVCVAAVSTIVYVHHNQKSEKEVGDLKFCFERVD